MRQCSRGPSIVVRQANVSLEFADPAVQPLTAQSL